MRVDPKRRSDNRVADRGISPLVGLIILIGLIVLGSVLIISIGMDANKDIEGQISGEQGKQTMVNFDKDLTTYLLNTDASGSLYLPETGQSELIDGGNVAVTISNGFETEELDEISMGTLRYEDTTGNEFGYQAGGVWRVEEHGTTMISSPDIRYYTEMNDGEEVGRLDLSIADFAGNAGQGEHTVQYEDSDSVDLEGAMEEVGFVRHVEITISDTPYHDGWYEFLQSEFDARDEGDDCPNQPTTNVICQPADDTVTVVATIDGNNSFATQIGIRPTIYGGLYADSITDQYDSELNVSGYDDHDATANVSEDLFVVNNDFELDDDADIEGVPVVNGTIDASGTPAISPIGYASALEEGTAPGHYEYINTTEDGSTAVFWLTDQEKTLVANMSRPAEEIQPITDKLENRALTYLADDGESITGNSLDAGLYYGNTLNVDTIDTSEGDVHIGIDGSNPVQLSDIDVTGGNQTYVYTNTTAGVTVEDITVPDENTGDFWLYGTEDAQITVEDKYEGVIYAPGSDLTIEDDAELTGAVVGGETTLQGDARINFDRTLRTDAAIPPENRNISVEEARTRDPLDVTFVLDRSGSMGGPGVVMGGDWQSVPVSTYSTATVDPEADHSIETRSCSIFGGCDSPTVVDPGESFSMGGWFSTTEVRVKDGSSGDSVIVGSESGNDPWGLRADATRNFIDLMSVSNDDHAGVFEFDNGGYELHPLSDNLESVRENVSVTADGSTDISAGIDLALDEYSGTDPSDRERVMILLSDGSNTIDGADTRTENQAIRADNLGVTIYAIGLGEDDLNEELLETIADETGGDNITIDNADELEDIFEGIADDVIEEEANLTLDIMMDPQVDGSSSDYVINIDEHKVNLDS
ncbi:vWA domain-containing protein [Natronorubrum sp. DTA7]|uniref:vWA domain-containing protein n=1 Tax=Natronorubrum sp. DTA7 TaxID=3447016 RepID=UPI003F856185